MGDLSQIPTDQLVQMLGTHPAVASAPQPQNGGILRNIGAGLENAVISAPGMVINAFDPVGNLGSIVNAASRAGGGKNLVPETHAGDTAANAVKNDLGKISPGLNLDNVTSTTFPERLARGVGAGLAGAALPGAEGYTVGQMLANAALGATSGAGAATGAEIAPDGYKPLGAALGGLVAPLGAVGVVNGVRAGAAAARGAPRPIPPTIADLNTAKKAAYATVDNSPMKIAQPAVQTMYEGAKAQLAKMGLNDQTIGSLAPKTATALDALQGASQGEQTLQGLEIQRRIAGIAAGAVDKTDRSAARILQDHIDDFVGNLTPDQLSGPVDQSALDALTVARSLAQRSFKAQTIQGMLDKAQTNSTGFGQSGLENSIRSQFRKLANNDRGMARFTPDEQTAIRRTATGGNWYSANNLLRDVGKAAPYGALPLIMEGQAAVGAGVAGGVPGVVASLSIPAVGAIARAGATSMTKAAAQNALDLALRGGTDSPMSGATIGQILHAAAKGALPTPTNLSTVLGSRTASPQQVNQ